MRPVVRSWSCGSVARLGKAAWGAARLLTARSVARLRGSPHIRHEFDLHPAILSSACSSLIGRNLLIFTDTNQIEFVGRNVVFGGEIIYNRIRTPLAELVVVLRISGGIGSARNFKQITARVG